MSKKFNVFTTCFGADTEQPLQGETLYSVLKGFSVVDHNGDAVDHISVRHHDGTFSVQNSYYEDLYTITLVKINKFKAFKLERLN